MEGRVDRSLVILLLDAEGQRSAIALAARRLGHRVVTTTGVETALIVLGSLVPDVIVVRPTSAERDRETVSRLTGAAPKIAVRVVDAPAALAGALDETPQLMN